MSMLNVEGVGIRLRGARPADPSQVTRAPSVGEVIGFLEFSRPSVAAPRGVHRATKQ